MRKYITLVIFLLVLSLCLNAYAVTPYEARTGWVGGSYWVDGSTGNTVEVTRGQNRMNALLVINDCDTQDIHVNWNGAASDPTVTVANQDNRAMRHDTQDPASATTVDFKLKPGEWVSIDPWTATRVEVTGSSGYLTEGYVRILIPYAD